MVLKCFDLDGHQPARKLSIWESRANLHESRPRRKTRAAGGGAGKERECSPSPPSLAPFVASPLARGFSRGSLDVHIAELFVSTESLNFLFVLYAKVYRQFSLAVERKCCHVMSFYRMG